MQTYGSIGKGISRRDTKHQISICKRYISEEVDRRHSKIKTVSKHFLSFQTKQVISMKCLNNIFMTTSQKHIKSAT